MRALNGAAAAARRRGLNLRCIQGRFADDIELILSARVPICKYKDSETGVSVDVTFEQSSAVLTSLFIRHKVQQRPFWSLV